MRKWVGLLTRRRGGEWVLAVVVEGSWGGGDGIHC